MPQLIKERYELLETIGIGGEGRVVKALDRQHDRFVALKIRRVHDHQTREELLREARILLAVPPHPALPLVREDFFDGEDYFVAMDWVEGTDLATLLHDRGRPGLATSSVLAYLAETAQALTHLHSQDPPVIHGDVKPGNLILTKGGRIKLVDFGMSSAPTDARQRRGTPGFRAPELAVDGLPSRASDVYGLAATAFALLSGTAPAGALPSWDGIDPVQAHQLEAAIRLGLATDPAHRPATPGEFVERLRAGWEAALPTGVTTFVLSDIEGSTAMWDRDPALMAAALVRHDELITDCVEAHGGRLIKSMGEGDSTVSVFDSAPRALEAAVNATHALAAEEWPGGLRIAVRFGLHTGEAERRGADYFGPTVNLAARLRAEADGEQIFLSGVTTALVTSQLPDGCQLVDLGPHRLRGLAAPERIHAVKGPGLSTPLPGSDCPYRGLLAFEPEDRDVFFGREEVAEDLLRRLIPGRLLTVVGASGSGKSSVLRAGVVAPVLAGEVPGIAGAVVLTPGSTPRLDVTGDSDQLVVVDQFEELFTQCQDEAQREAFIDALLTLRCPVAIGVRADLYGQLGGHLELARAVAENQVLLGPMSEADLQRAVTEPARLAGLRLETGLVELVLRDVADEPGALPMLSHALRATWERRDGRTLTLEGYRRSGGVAGALAQTADALIASQPEERRALMRSMFLRLTELGEGIEDTRRRVPIDELVPRGAARETVQSLLELLADARLVTLGETTAEVAHEVLIRKWPTLRRWLDEDREGIRLHRQLSNAARLWDAGGRERSDLYRGGRLAVASDLAHTHPETLNATEHAFVDASLAEAGREHHAQLRANRRLRGLLVGAAVLLVLAVVAGVVSFVQRDRARDATSAAEAQALRSDAERIGALALSAPSLELSMLYAVAAVRLQDRLETQSDLLAAFQNNPAAIRIVRPTDNEAVAVAISPGRQLLATGDSAGLLHFTDTATWQPSGSAVRLGRPIAPEAMRFSPDGRTVAVGTRQGDRSDVLLIDVATHSQRRLGSWAGVVPDTPARTTVLAYSPDGRRLAVALADTSPASFTPVAQRLLLFDASTGRIVWQRRYPMRAGQWEVRVLFAPDGALITSAQQGDTIVWDTPTGRIVRRFPVGGPPGISSDGRQLAIALNSPNPGNPSSAVELLDLNSGRHSRLASALPGEWIESLTFTRDNARIVAPAFRGTHVWDVASGAIVETFVGSTGGAALGSAIDSRETLYTGAADGSVTVWDLAGTRRVSRVFRWNQPELGCPGIPCSVVDRRGTTLATSQGDGTVALIDLRTLRLTHTLPARDGPVAFGLALLPDGRRLLTGGIAGTVTVWDLESHRAQRTLHFGDPVIAVAASPDGRLVAAQTAADGGTDSRVQVREFASGRTLYERTVPFGPGDLAFSRDGRALVALGCCRPESSVVAWRARSGTELFHRTLKTATAIALAPDSRTLGVGTEDGRVLLWDLRTGRSRGPAFPIGAGNVFQLAFSPDGHMFAASTFDVSVTAWNIASRKRVGNRFPVSPGTVPSVLFEPNGRLLLTELGSASEWPLDRPTLERFACHVVGRDLTRAEWNDLLPNRAFQRVCSP